MPRWEIRPSMATSFASLLTDLEEAVARGGLGRRADLLRSLTNLFTDEAARLGEAQVAAFDAVILHLAREMEAQARTDLSERLADVPNAPHGVVRDLAYDAVLAVARPVLARSGRVGDGDLAAIAARRGQGHLLAMAARVALSAPVADLIVMRGDRDVVRLVAANAGARFSAKGFSALGDRAGLDGDVRASLRQRADIPTELRDRLTGFAKAPPVPPPPAPARADVLLKAEVFVSTQARKTELDEALLIGWLNSGRETEALIGLARNAGVPSQMAIDAYAAGGYEALLPLVRSVRFGWRILSSLVVARTGAEPPPEMMHDVMQAFQSLSVVSAQAKVRAAAVRYKSS